MSVGREGADTPLRRAAHGSDTGDGAARHHRAPLPAERSIVWTPNRDPDTPEGPAESGPYELFVTRSAMLRMRDHVSAGDREPRFGFLLGHLYRCPDTGVHYCVADTALASDEPFSDDAPEPFLLRAWARSQRAFHEHGGVLVGWYHSHYLLGLFLSDGDRAANDSYFGEPWQCCVLLVPDPARPMGAVFRPSGVSDDARPEPTPFHELLSSEDASVEGAPESAIGWINYRPDREVRPATGQPVTGSSTEVPVPPRPTPSGETDRPAPALELEDAEAVSPPRRDSGARRRSVRVFVVMALGLGGLLGGLWLAGYEEPTSPAAPEAGSAPEAAPVPPAEVRRFLERAARLEESVVRYEERGQDFELGRIDCDLLAGGYVAVGEAFRAVEESFAELRTEADGDLVAVHERLTADMNAVHRHYEDSGCRAPE